MIRDQAIDHSSWTTSEIWCRHIQIYLKMSCFCSSPKVLAHRERGVYVYVYIYIYIYIYHYTDVTMNAMASQITGLSIVYSNICPGADQRKHQTSTPLTFVRGIHRFPAQRASNAENVSIWWRHHDICVCKLSHICCRQCWLIVNWIVENFDESWNKM